MSTQTQPKIEASLWEKLGDGFIAFSEGVSRSLTRLIGSSNERYVRKLGYIRAQAAAQHAHRYPRLAARINELEDEDAGPDRRAS